MSRRRLSPDEHTLWKDVTRSIAPLSKRRPEPTSDDEPAAKAPPNRPKIKAKPVTSAPVQRPPPRTEPPPPAPLGRKAKRRLARGSDSIHGRLDLHGMTQAQAHGALLRFLHSSQGKGARLVLIITGKGGRGDASGERGVLKRQVPMWLRLPEFRDIVIGFESAAIAHGGEGALYVRLRRP